MAQPAPPSVDQVLHTLDALEYHLLGVEADDWTSETLDEALRRVLQLGVELTDAADKRFYDTLTQRYITQRYITQTEPG